MRLRFVFADQDFTVTLEGNPCERDLVSMLPLDLTIDDYSSNEKIAYLPRKLTEEAGGRFGNEAVGDLCYYLPSSGKNSTRSGCSPRTRSGAGPWSRRPSRIRPRDHR